VLTFEHFPRICFHSNSFKEARSTYRLATAGAARRKSVFASLPCRHELK
jgi:hypothetical protein